MKSEYQVNEERLMKQHEWQMREIREEHASEVKQLQRMREVDREESALQIAKKDKESENRCRQVIENMELEREEMRVEYEQRLENERQRYQDMLERVHGEVFEKREEINDVRGQIEQLNAEMQQALDEVYS